MLKCRSSYHYQHHRYFWKKQKMASKNRENHKTYLFLIIFLWWCSCLCLFMYQSNFYVWSWKQNRKKINGDEERRNISSFFLLTFIDMTLTSSFSWHNEPVYKGVAKGGWSVHLSWVLKNKLLVLNFIQKGAQNFSLAPGDGLSCYASASRTRFFMYIFR